jgi:predicted transcriptional regulator
MSIKPEFAEKIFDGTKKFEFRKVIFKNKTVKKVIVYASFPIMKVIGEFIVGDILEMEVDELWEATADDSGITKEFFKAYYQGKKKGYAIRISEFKRYEEPLSLKESFNIKPPQSFQYI